MFFFSIEKQRKKKYRTKSSFQTLLRPQTHFGIERVKKQLETISGTIKNVSAKSVVCSKISGKAEELKFKVQNYDVCVWG